MTTKKSQKNTTLKVVTVITLLVMAAAIGIVIWVLFFRGSDEKKRIEQNAVPVQEEPAEKMEQPEGGGAVTLTYAETATVSLSKKEAAVNLINPGRSNQDMVLQVMIDDVVIAESGKLQPGYQLSKLSDVDTSQLTTGVYQGVFYLAYYDSGSDEEAMVNTEIPVEITVVE